MWTERDNDDGYYREQVRIERDERGEHVRCTTPGCPGGERWRCESCGDWNAECPCGNCNEVCQCAEF